MTPELTVYEKPTCSACQKVVALLEKRGVEFARVHYLEEPLSADELRALLAKAQLSPREVLREPVDGTDEEILEALAERPGLLQRPLVERGDRAVLARPPENVLVLLDG